MATRSAPVTPPEPDTERAGRSGPSFLSSWGVNISIAMTALRTNLMRSLLTMLGVLIGVFAVTLAVAVG
ncbi:MAG: hypothetical protein WBA51_15415, partial [Erythrobacter sp.]